MNTPNTFARITPRSARLWSWLRSQASTPPFIIDTRIRIFLVAFAMLFFELFCIRWIPSYVRYLSYFNNFILLASFLGIGLGMLSARRQRFWFPPFALLVLVLVIVVWQVRFELRINSMEVLYYGAGEAQSARAENWIVLPIIFALVTLCFIPLARSFGQLFTQTTPLKAYTYDILGSLAGIASFFVISYFALPPLIWFSVLGILVLLLSAKRTVFLTGSLLIPSLAIVFLLQQNVYWSPYYKISLYPIDPQSCPTDPRGYIVDVNNAGGHQVMLDWRCKEPFYRRVYDLFPANSFKNALIIGAGSGSDVATALAKGVPSITAVEIDPTIQKLGTQYNPNQPYSDPRVKVVINDGRAYLENATEKYDLIIFALPDSLTLTSSNTSLRLESFLLTEDSVQAAKQRLSKNGLLVFYNYYRQAWLVEKLAGMAGRAFNQEPFVATYGGWGRGAVIMSGPRLETLSKAQFGPYKETGEVTQNQSQVIGEGFYPLTNRAPATDDWPFLYLVERSFPLIYILGLGMVGLFALGGTFTLAPRRTLRRFDWHMFFLGVAFMLLEVKSLTTFSLLFGSTWMVNSLVFFAILSSVLLAVLINGHFKIKSIWPFYLLLFGILGLNIALPPEALLLGNPIARYIFASVLAFAPVFLANIIFANSFRDSETSDIAFASNLLGIMVGGTLEYLSMLTGYRMLLVLVIVFYGCSLFLKLRRKPESSKEEVEKKGSTEAGVV
jgi:hypothetical protein